MSVKIVEWELPYTWGIAIEVTRQKVINLLLRAENNLLHVNSDNRLYCDLQIPAWKAPTDTFEVWVTTGIVNQVDWWPQSWLLLRYQTPGGAYAQWLKGNDGKLYYDPGTWTFKLVYYWEDVDALINQLRSEISAVWYSWEYDDLLNRPWIVHLSFSEEQNEWIIEGTMKDNCMVMITPFNGEVPATISVDQVAYTILGNEWTTKKIYWSEPLVWIFQPDTENHINYISTFERKYDTALSDTSENAVQNKVVKTALDAKANTADLAPVATTWDYDDLINKPTIGDGALVIQKNGTTVASTSANATTATTANIIVPEAVDNLTSTSTTDPLSANMWKVLNERLQIVEARWRFLSLWNCATWLPVTNPDENPYVYKAWDYYIVNNIAASWWTNYKPSWASYVRGVASTTVDTNPELEYWDMYVYDWSSWIWQENTQKTIAFANIAWDAYDNINLAWHLNDKQDKLIAWNNITIDADWKTINATNTTYSTATSTTAWLVKLWDDTVQTEAPQSVSSTANRTYAVQVDSNGKAMVNVPWTTPTAWDWITITNNVISADWLVFISYWISTWQDFEAAYSKNAVVYCRASSNTNPATWDQTRLAFMAYINNPVITSATEVEFQYYRSLATKSASQQWDQVFVYKLNKTSWWSVQIRECATKIAAWTNMTANYNNWVLTLNATWGGSTYSAWDGIDINANDEISVDVTDIIGTWLSEDSSNNIIIDTSVVATKTDLSGKQDKATSWNGAPATTPTYVWQEYVDTTNHKFYIAEWTTASTDWKEVWWANYQAWTWITINNNTIAVDNTIATTTDVNTKTFTITWLTWQSNLDAMTAAYDWFSAWKMPILSYMNRALTFYAWNSWTWEFRFTDNYMTPNGVVFQHIVTGTVSSWVVTTITESTTQAQVWIVASTAWGTTSTATQIWVWDDYTYQQIGNYDPATLYFVF